MKIRVTNKGRTISFKATKPGDGKALKDLVFALAAPKQPNQKEQPEAQCPRS